MRFHCDPFEPFMGSFNLICPFLSVPRTDSSTWRHIFNVLVHTSTGLEDFELVLDSSFWQFSGFYKRFSAQKVFENRTLCGSKDHKRSFLQHVARLGGVNFRLMIDNTSNDRAKQSFRRDLEKIIHEHTFDRPYPAEDEIPKCRCARRLLRESCIMDRKGLTRRGG